MIRDRRNSIERDETPTRNGTASKAFRWYVSCSLLELLGLMTWIGGLAVLLTAVIPAVFNTLGMETGGRLLRRVFDGYNAMTSGIVILFVSTALFRHWQRRRAPDGIPPLTRLEVGLLASLAFVTFLIVVVLGPKAVALQEAAFAATTPDTKKTAYEAFFDVHMIIRALHLVNGGLVVSLLAVKFRQWIHRRGDALPLIRPSLTGRGPG